jgi:hypothetical protein
MISVFYLVSFFLKILDTCGAQAVIEAHGGVLAKMTSFVKGDHQKWNHYTYRMSDSNLDFEENTANLTPYNSRDKKLIKKGDAPRLGKLDEFQAYSNLCGLVALSREGLANKDRIFEAIQQVKATHPPAYD